ncbi:recombinase family protein [Spirosoma pollinicola]|uniref:recombinase family protein n=1 Tax=Spirosoma pollinicola TaxID=2057025 RepID=UPI0026BBB5B5
MHTLNSIGQILNLAIPSKALFVEKLIIHISHPYLVAYGRNQLTIRCIFTKVSFISTHLRNGFGFFMLFGNARVSTQDQNLALQLDDLKKAGCQKIFQEKVSSAKERPQLRKLLEILREDDTVIVWKLDRLGRSLKELFTLVNDFQTQGIGFRSLNDTIDTTTAQGRLVFNLFASLAEFERNLIRERTKAGLAAARARGRTADVRPKPKRKHGLLSLCTLLKLIRF